MTEQEAQTKSNDKLVELQAYLKRLQIMPICKDKITKDGFIEKVVVFQDFEKYPIEPEVVEEEVNTEENV